MRSFRSGALFVVAAAAAVMMAGGAAASPGGQHASRVVGHVYVNDNTAPINTVAGFDRDADGSLTAMAGSPFAVGGSGAGAPDASQGSLQLSANGRYLLAVDAGSNQISVLRIKPDGSLRPVQGSPVASNGLAPVSIAVHGDLVYVANAGPGASIGDTNYTGFRLNAGGHLRAIPNSTYVLPNDSSPARCSSTVTGPVLQVPASRHRRSTASPSDQTDCFRRSRITVRRSGVFPATGLRPARQRVQPRQPERTVRLRRPHRGRNRSFPRIGFQLQRRRRRQPHAYWSPGG